MDGHFWGLDDSNSIEMNSPGNNGLRQSNRTSSPFQASTSILERIPLQNRPRELALAAKPFSLRFLFLSLSLLALNPPREPPTALNRNSLCGPDKILQLETTKNSAPGRRWLEELERACYDSDCDWETSEESGTVCLLSQKKPATGLYLQLDAPATTANPVSIGVSILKSYQMSIG